MVTPIDSAEGAQFVFAPRRVQMFRAHKIGSLPGKAGHNLRQGEPWGLIQTPGVAPEKRGWLHVQAPHRWPHTQGQAQQIAHFAVIDTAHKGGHQHHAQGREAVQALRAGVPGHQDRLQVDQRDHDHGGRAAGR